MSEIAPGGVEENPPRFGHPPLLFWLNVSIIFGLFLTYSLYHVPVPGVNEPHYFTKAKHFWDPTWCARDFFLQSSNPHFLFYVCIGWLTKFFSLETTVLIARVAGYGLLALGWTRMILSLLPIRYSPVWVAALFLLTVTLGNLSGEWMIGGIESKVFAYGVLFLSLASFVERRLFHAAMLIGLTFSFHPVVGAWGLVCGMFAWCVMWLREWRAGQSEFDLLRFFKCAALTAMALLLTSLPGLVPAIGVLTGDGNIDLFAANYIQVYYRLPHHLHPYQLSLTAYACYAGLTLVWLIDVGMNARRHRLLNRHNSIRKTAEESQWRFFLFNWFIFATVSIALVATAVGWHERPASRDAWWVLPRMMFLKLYPMRLFDVFLPLAICVMIVRRFVLIMPIRQDREGQDRKGDVRLWNETAWGIAVVCLAAAFLLPGPASIFRHLDRGGQTKNWKAVCRWIASETPTNAMVISPTKRDPAFRWLSHRAQHVGFKDCPQDAVGILEWNRRLLLEGQWAAESKRDDRVYDLDDLARLKKMTGADYLITDRLGPFEMEPIYRNPSYRVYAIP